MQSLSETNERTIRVFISSTFIDMHAEREELIKFTFPELRRRCRERHVDFVEVDLRWGITAEKAAEGGVLPICLSEIERCRPYFIGILGERYGWVPESIEEELIKIKPWLNEYKGRSVTELEIIHGVLSNPDMNEFSFFYFRDPSESKRIEEELEKEPLFIREPDVCHIKLESLKEKIHRKGCPVRDNYLDAKMFGQLVLEDLWKHIDKRFPEEDVPTALERERLFHEAFAKIKGKVYIGREEYFQRLDKHADGQDQPLIILGESGSGKSALLANWSRSYHKGHPDCFLLQYFIGSTPDSADYIKILRHIMQEIKERQSEKTKETELLDSVKYDEEIPVDPKKVIEVFPLWLARAAAKERFILILDGLNQLEDRDNAPDLGWLPSYFPGNVRVIFSTLPGRSLTALENKKWQHICIEPLTVQERKQLIVRYLAQFTKELLPSQVNEIAAAEHTYNPLYLKALLEELRVYGDHFTIDQRIHYYLSAENIIDLYGKIIERYEKDYDRERPGLVRDTMSLLWNARRGLSETELLDLLGTDGARLPRAYWSPLYLAVEESLSRSGGLLSFSHDFLREAIEKRYLYDEVHQKVFHLRIADYFAEQLPDERKMDELPWHLSKLEKWSSLKQCLIDPKMFILFINNNWKVYELAEYWSLLAGKFNIIDCFINCIEQYKKNDKNEYDTSKFLFKICSFLTLICRYKDAEFFSIFNMKFIEDKFGKDDYENIEPKKCLADIYKLQSRYSEAEKMYVRVLDLQKKILKKNDVDFSFTFESLANLYYEKGLYSIAESLYGQALEIQKNNFGQDDVRTINCLYGCANFYKTMILHGVGKEYYIGKKANPIKIYKEVLSKKEKYLGTSHPEIAIILTDMAELYIKTGDFFLGETVSLRALKLIEAAYGSEHLLSGPILTNLGNINLAKNKLIEAEIFYKRALDVRIKSLGNIHIDVVSNKKSLAYLYKKMGNHAKSKEYAGAAYDNLNEAKKSLGLAEPLFWEKKTSLELSNQVQFYNKLSEIFVATDLKLSTFFNKVGPKLGSFVESMLLAVLAIACSILVAKWSYWCSCMLEKFTNSSIVSTFGMYILLGIGHLSYLFFSFIWMIGSVAGIMNNVVLLKRSSNTIVIQQFIAYLIYLTSFIYLRNIGWIPSVFGNVGVIVNTLIAYIFSYKLISYYGSLTCSDINKDDDQECLAKDLYQKALGLYDIVVKKHSDIIEAIEYLNQSINLNPAFAEAYELRADNFFDLNQYQDAILDCNKNIFLNPDNSYSFCTRALAYVEINQPHRAIDDLTQAIQLKPESFLYGARAKGYEDLSEDCRALEDYSLAIKLKPENVNDYYADRGRVYTRLSKYNLAIDDYTQAIRLKFDDVNTINRRGIAYAALGQHENAMDDYNVAIRLRPSDSAAYYNKACLYSLQENVAQSCIFLRLAIERGYDDWEHIKDGSDFDRIRNESCFKDILKMSM